VASEGLGTKESVQHNHKQLRFSEVIETLFDTSHNNQKITLQWVSQFTLGFFLCLFEKFRGKVAHILWAGCQICHSTSSSKALILL